MMQVQQHATTKYSIPYTRTRYEKLKPVATVKAVSQYLHSQDKKVRDLLLTSATEFRDSMIILYVGLGQAQSRCLEKTGLEEIDKEILLYILTNLNSQNTTYLLFCSSYFWFLVFGHFWRRSYKKKSLITFLRQDGPDGKDRKENHATKVTKISKNQKTKIWDKRNIQVVKSMYTKIQ